MRRALLAGGLLLATAGGVLLAEQGWMAAKARVAEVLIARAWSAHLADGAAHRPWSWADMHPVARLEVPRLEVARVVLSGATGATLAFGPGHVHGTAEPGGRGNCVVAGHRDGSFAFLERLRDGDTVVLETRDGTASYLVERRAVVTRWNAEVIEPTDRRRLTLITCYPFGGLQRSNLRYVVTCRPAPRFTGR
jgi:sortase A